MLTAITENTEIKSPQITEQLDKVLMIAHQFCQEYIKFHDMVVTQKRLQEELANAK